MTDDVQTRPVRYDVGGKSFESRMVWRPGTGPRPLVLVAPNWLGITEGGVKRAARIAGEDYIALLVDMYGDGHEVTGGNEEAAPLANGLRADWQERRARMGAAMAALVEAAGPEGDATRIAAVGYCFGGGNVLELARGGAPLRGVVSVHGDLTTRAPASETEFKGQVMILHGSADPLEPRANRLAIEEELEAVGVRWRMQVFGGLVHSYAEEEAATPGVAQYDAWGAEESMRLIRAFLEETLTD